MNLNNPDEWFLYWVWELCGQQYPSKILTLVLVASAA